MELLFSQYLTEFIAVFSITILTLVTPGPDFFIVVRNSLSYSRRSGIFTAFGVATAIWIHVAYTLAGIGLILSKSILLFTIVKTIGALYLIYLGWNSLRSKRTNAKDYEGKPKIQETLSDFKSYKTGFINNALNPKATLFFVSVFTQLVSIETPLNIQIIYGATVSISAFIWFALVATFLNHHKIRSVFESVQFYFEKVMGAVFITLGISVALSSK